VVVVVTGPGTAGCVVCCDVVVVLPEGAAAAAGAFDEAHAQSEAMAMATRLGRMNFFMVILLTMLGLYFAPPSSHTWAHGHHGVLTAGVGRDAFASVKLDAHEGDADAR
jgi:hypothetical protein